MINITPATATNPGESANSGSASLISNFLIENMTHKELKSKALNKSAVKKEYERLEPEFTLLREMLRARNKAGLSQAQIAEKMGTKSPAITRLEASLSSGEHSPSLATIKKYLEALDYRLEIKIIHN